MSKKSLNLPLAALAICTVCSWAVGNSDGIGGLSEYGLKDNGRSVSKQKIIFDTDMGNDSDDAIALVMLHAAQREGTAELLGITVNKSNPYAPVFTNILNDHYGARNVPIAYLNGGLSTGNGVFLKRICEQRTPNGLYLYSRRAVDASQFPDAVKFLRKVLADSEDKSVSIVTVGLATALARLLETPPDNISPLDGTELMRRKVRLVSIMAGRFTPEVLADPKRFPPEWNNLGDPKSAKILFERCPVPMVFGGMEVGLALPYPHSEIDEISALYGENPFVDAYNMFAEHVARNKFKRNDGRHDRSCYDPASALFVLRPDLFTLSEPGSVRVIDDKGRASFTPDPNGLHRYIIIDKNQVEKIVGEIVRLTKIKPAQDLR